MTKIEEQLLEVLIKPEFKKLHDIIERLEKENEELKQQNKRLLDKILS